MSDAKAIKELREMTGAGFLDCKLALEKNGGDVDKSAAWLKKEGLTKAVKKLDRNAQSGLIIAAEGPSSAAMLEFNTETDFVARNERFQAFASEVANIALSCHTLSDLENKIMKDGAQVKEAVLSQMATIGENIKISRLKVIQSGKGRNIGFYVHNQIGPSMGGIGAITLVQSSQSSEVFKEIAQNISVHIAALNPLYISTADVPEELIAPQREEALGDKSLQGKPEHIAQKIVQNKLEQFKQSISLLTQEYILEQNMTVEEFLATQIKNTGSEIKIAEFARFAVGKNS